MQDITPLLPFRAQVICPHPDQTQLYSLGTASAHCADVGMLPVRQSWGLIRHN